MFVFEIMTPHPVTILPEVTVNEATRILKDNKFRRLPVLDNGKLVGIITDRDLREVQPSPATTLSIYECNYLLAKMQVKEIMKTDVFTISAQATIEEAALLMYTHKIGGLVVVDAAATAVGIITETDILKCFVDIMGLQEGKIRLTIEFTDKVGISHEVTRVFRDLGITIISMASHRLEGGRIEMVIRADSQDTEELTRQLANAGYPVSHVTQIGIQ